jgi:hypothetical protein
VFRRPPAAGGGAREHGLIDASLGCFDPVHEKDHRVRNQDVDIERPRAPVLAERAAAEAA